MSESIPLSEAPAEDARKLLKHFNWNGVAMVEFKRTPEGKFVLMEINPRLWGSLQLAIDSGRDFPVLLAEFALCKSDADWAAFEEKCARLPDYKVGQRLRWTLGTVDHALIRIKDEGWKALKDILFHNSLRLFERPWHTKQETFRWSDPWPFVVELYHWLFG